MTFSGRVRTEAWEEKKMDTRKALKLSFDWEPDSKSGLKSLLFWSEELV